MNPAKRKKLARIEAIRTAVTVTEPEPVLKEEEKAVPEVLPVAEVASETPAEEVVVPVTTTRKKKTV